MASGIGLLFCDALVQSRFQPPERNLSHLRRGVQLAGNLFQPVRSQLASAPRSSLRAVFNSPSASIDTPPTA